MGTVATGEESTATAGETGTTRCVRVSAFRCTKLSSIYQIETYSKSQQEVVHRDYLTLVISRFIYFFKTSGFSRHELQDVVAMRAPSDLIMFGCQCPQSYKGLSRREEQSPCFWVDILLHNSCMSMKYRHLGKG